MRYTKYNYKKKNKNDVVKFITSIIVMGLFAIIIGVALAKIVSITLFENDNSYEVSSGENGDEVINTNAQQENTNKDNNINTTITSAFSTAQCGYFSSEENAKAALTKIDSKYIPFIIKEDNKFRLLTSIGDNSEANNIISELKENSIESIKVNFMLDSKNVVEQQIAAICDGYLKILDETMKSDVKSIDTTNFKEWVKTLDKIQEGEEIDILNELKEYVNNIPEKIEKDDVSTAMTYMYSILSNFRVK